MAILKTSGGLGSMSGRVGNMVYANTDCGVVIRDLPRRHGQISDAQRGTVDALRRANFLWQRLSLAQVEAWNAYALRHAERNPHTGLLRVPRSVNLFVGLAAKYLQVHGGFDAPSDPPTGVFVGDGVGVGLGVGEEGGLVFTADAANRPGVLTEVLAQRLRNANNRPQPKAYKSLGFVAFTGAGDTAAFPAPLSGTFVGATRFVEAATGRATALIEIGRVTV